MIKKEFQGVEMVGVEFAGQKIFNLTPHALNVAGLSIPPSGVCARVDEEWKEVDTFEKNGEVLRIFEKKNTGLSGVPDEELGTIYLVAALVREAFDLAAQMSPKLSRGDIYSPSTGQEETQRNEKGHVVSVAGIV